MRKNINNMPGTLLSVSGIIQIQRRTLQQPATHNSVEYSVSDIAMALKRVVEDNFGYVRVKAELSGAKLHTSGHLYFTLKDDKSCLNAVCWRGTAGKLKFKPEDGMEVICTGKITTYPGRSQYQMVVEWMEPAGLGALMARLEQLKKILSSEGIFAEDRKKPIPFMPKVIGIITSPTGAVIRDILHRLRDRCPVQVVLYPVQVQGEGAAEQVAAAISYFHALDGGQNVPRPDLIIVARGGGSVEDLWAFNEEVVVRSVALCSIPLISAIGHETDTTLIDYAADLRAPTPTAAAEKAVPVLREIKSYLNEVSQRLDSAAARILDNLSAQVASLARALPRKEDLLSYPAQKLDDLSDRLQSAPKIFLIMKTQKFDLVAACLKPLVLMQSLESNIKTASDFHERTKASVLRVLDNKNREYNSLSKLLLALDYRSVLQRGFIMAHTKDGVLLKSASGFPPGSKAVLSFYDGDAEVVRS